MPKHLTCAFICCTFVLNMSIKQDEGLRLNAGKTRVDLVPAFAHEQLGKVLTKGSEKYAVRNWERGMAWSKVIASLERHLYEIKKGEDFDKETGLLHSAHVMCNAAFLTEYYKIYPQGDDRPHGYLKGVRIGLDVDEVLADFTGGWADRWLDVSARPSEWLYDPNMVDRFKHLKETGEINDFFANLKPLVVADSLKFEPSCYVTARGVETAVTADWLRRHGFPTKPVVTVPMGTSKLDTLRELGVDIFVDDNYKTFVELNNAGICTYLMDKPHNVRHEVGHKRLKNLNDLV